MTRRAAMGKRPRKMKTTRTSTETTGTIHDASGGVRLQKFLAAGGVASRREGERLILGGRVDVNGRIITALGTRIDPDRDIVRVDGHRVQGGGRRVYYLLHKPKGSITSSSDPAGRPTVLDLLQGVRERVVAVGRLD